MRGPLRVLGVVARFAGGLILFAVLSASVGFVGVVGLLGDLLLVGFNGWALYAFLRQRQADQDELLAVLTATAEAGLPLAPAVAAYRADRKPGRFAAAFRWASFVALPLYAYARIWLGWRPFERLLEDLSERLEAGDSLAAALRAVPHAAAREVRMAAAVGEATGALGPALGGAGRERWGAAWLEVAPRVIYPFLVLLFVSGITAFLMVFILPRFRRIFAEFGEELPQLTQYLVVGWEWVEGGAGPGLPVGLLVLLAAAAALADPTLRWRVPLVGRLYRWGVQGEVLRTLGRLLAVGRTVPDALAFLAESDELPAVARRRVAAAGAAVERGDPLDAALEANGLLPAAVAPLVRSAARVGNLPWALAELGDHLAGRAFRVVRRLSLVASPVMVALVGGVVGVIAIGMFLPLVQLITSLSE